MKKALVLGNVSRTVLGVIRSLGRGGVQVHVAWNDPDCVSLRSRYVRKAHPLPAYHETDRAWKTALCDLMRRERFDLVLPCTDIDTLACQRHRADLEQWGRVYAPNDEAAAILFDKIKTNELARAAGVRTPRELVVGGEGEVPQILAEFGFPVVLKPRRTFDPARPGPSPKVQKAYGEADLRHLLAEMLAGGPVAVQENFIGHGAGVELLLHAGEALLAFQHIRVHEPLEGGQSSYRKSAALSPDLLEAALRLLRPVKYSGVAMVEFKVNPATADWVFIEVNARFWGSLPLSIAAGADFPLALFQFLVEGRSDFRRPYRQGITCRNLSLDLEWQLANFRADHGDPTLLTRSLGRVLADACLDVVTLRGHSDTWALDDPGPGVAEVLQLGRRAWGRLARAFRRPPARQAEPADLAVAGDPVR
jgi:predicted ATP-grasp superfamily ATP-dependent carboligase